MGGAVQLSMLEWFQAQLPTPQTAIHLIAEDFTNAVPDAAPFYAIRYFDNMYRARHGKQAFYFIVYRRHDDANVFESSTYTEQETCDRAAADVVADFIQEWHLTPHEATEEEYNKLIEEW